MTIEFHCDCGKKLGVADEHAGKRVKCPICLNALVVPELSAEDAAYRALMEAPAPKPEAARATRPAYGEPPEDRPPAPPPPKVRHSSPSERNLAGYEPETQSTGRNTIQRFPNLENIPLPPGSEHDSRLHVSNLVIMPRTEGVQGDFKLQGFRTRSGRPFLSPPSPSMRNSNSHREAVLFAVVGAIVILGALVRFEATVAGHRLHPIFQRRHFCGRHRYECPREF